MLYVALAIFGAGLIFKISRWFRFQIRELPRNAALATGHRIGSAVRGIIAVLLSRKILTLFKVFILDVLMQRRLLRESVARWAAHMAMAAAMTGLILLHALDDVVTEHLFSSYYPTVNPFFFLRNLFGVLLLVGLLFAAGSRYFTRSPRRFSSGMDMAVLLLLGLIIVSGIVLESADISSRNAFIRMVEDYAGLDPEDDAEDIAGLEAYWVNEFGVVSPHVVPPFDSDTLALGLEVHESYCADCHSKAPWAFASYGLSRLTAPLALFLDRIDAHTYAWYAHYVISLIALALLPFTKMFHVMVSPLSLMANAVMDETSDPVNVATRQVMELDACVHCGMCNESCTNAGAFAAVRNATIMPSEKMAALRTMAFGKPLSKMEIRSIQNGFFFCTHCRQCTDTCPVGINLQALWLTARDAFLEKGFPEFFLLSPLSIHRAIRRIETRSILFRNPLIRLKKILEAEYASFAPDPGGKALRLSDLDPLLKNNLSQAFHGRTASTCFGCTTCSSVCPVVANYDHPNEVLGLLPHQVIYSANLGLLGMVFGSGMLWRCLGCYECQDACPQGVCITDVFYQLKNMAITYFEEKAEMS
jgi:heterodisulfide reductase subunit C